MGVSCLHFKFQYGVLTSIRNPSDCYPTFIIWCLQTSIHKGGGARVGGISDYLYQSSKDQVLLTFGIKRPAGLLIGHLSITKIKVCTEEFCDIQ